jgi:hypothetical protein
LRQEADELEAARVRPLVLTFEASFLARAYAEDTALSWPLLVDAGRAVYRAYGMDRARRRDLWSPATALAYARALVRGQRLRRGDGDVHQRGGDVLIDPDGLVRLHHVGRGPADRPPVERLLALTSGPRS